MRINWQIRIDEEILEEIRGASAATGHSLSTIIGAGAELVLMKLREKHNDGKPFPLHKAGAQAEARSKGLLEDLGER